MKKKGKKEKKGLLGFLVEGVGFLELAALDLPECTVGYFLDYSINTSLLGVVLTRKMEITYLKPIRLS